MPLDDFPHYVSLIAKSLSDPNRLRILLFIGQDKKSVGQIVEELGISQPLVSHHLKELKHSLLLNVERSGPFVFYQLSDHKILDIIHSLKTIAEGLLTSKKTI